MTVTRQIDIMDQNGVVRETATGTVGYEKRILCIYRGHEPKAPPTNQHPDAQRYKVGDDYIDTLGGEPTSEEIVAHLTPPAPEPDPLQQAIEALKARVAALEQKS